MSWTGEWRPSRLCGDRLSGSRLRRCDTCCRFLPSRPYHDSIALHVLAGTLTLYLSQPRRSATDDDSTDEDQPSPPRKTSNGLAHINQTNANDPQNTRTSPPGKFNPSPILVCRASGAFPAHNATQADRPRLSPFHRIRLSRCRFLRARPSTLPPHPSFELTFPVWPSDGVLPTRG